jgi:uncharacterized protein (DUF169 family)
MEITMSKSTHSVRPQMSVQEEIARTDLAQWKAVVSRATHPVTARLIVEALDLDTATKAANLGVYLVARETVKRDQIRYARARRAGQVVGNVGRLAFRACKAVIGFTANSVSKARGKAPALKPVAPQRAPVTAQPTATAVPVRMKEEAESLVFPTIRYSPEAELHHAAAVH